MPLRAHYERAYAGVRRAGYGPAGKPGNDEGEMAGNGGESVLSCFFNGFILILNNLIREYSRFQEVLIWKQCALQPNR